MSPTYWMCRRRQTRVRGRAPSGGHTRRWPSGWCWWGTASGVWVQTVLKLWFRKAVRGNLFMFSPILRTKCMLSGSYQPNIVHLHSSAGSTYVHYRLYNINSFYFLNEISVVHERGSELWSYNSDNLDTWGITFTHKGVIVSQTKCSMANPIPNSFT